MAIVLELLKSLPAIVSFIAELRALFTEFYQWQDRREALKGLTDAMSAFRTNGDASKLESFINELQSRAGKTN